MECSVASIYEFFRQELLSGGTCQISERASVLLRECNRPKLYLEWRIGSSHPGAQLLGGRFRSLFARDRRSEQLDSSWLGLPILLSVPDAKGEDDQRQAHHYRENSDEWRQGGQL